MSAPTSPRGRPKPLHVVALGGGTGLPVVLRGLKRAMAGTHGSLTGIVTVTDDGGSSGRLRRRYNALPMGDIRNCLVALSDNEPLMSRLFQYRYDGHDGLGGHCLGNLILTALADCSRSYLKAIETSGQVLAIHGRILPATLENVVLRARLASGRRVRGESRISRSREPIVDVGTDPPLPAPAPGVLRALRRADLIILGPGSLFTSVLPNLMVRGVARTIARSRAVRVLVGNLMTQPGETDGFTAADHLLAVRRCTGRHLVDVYLAGGGPISAAQRRRYARQGAYPVEVSASDLAALGITPIERRLLRDDPEAAKVRHHEGKLARALLGLVGSRRGTRRAASRRTARRAPGGHAAPPRRAKAG